MAGTGCWQWISRFRNDARCRLAQSGDDREAPARTRHPPRPGCASRAGAARCISGAGAAGASRRHPGTGRAQPGRSGPGAGAAAALGRVDGSARVGTPRGVCPAHSPGPSGRLAAALVAHVLGPVAGRRGPAAARHARDLHGRRDRDAFGRLRDQRLGRPLAGSAGRAHPRAPARQRAGVAARGAARVRSCWRCSPSAWCC